MNEGKGLLRVKSSRIPFTLGVFGRGFKVRKRGLGMAFRYSDGNGQKVKCRLWGISQIMRCMVALFLGLLLSWESVLFVAVKPWQYMQVLYCARSKYVLRTLFFECSMHGLKIKKKVKSRRMKSMCQDKERRFSICSGGYLMKSPWEPQAHAQVSKKNEKNPLQSKGSCYEQHRQKEIGRKMEKKVWHNIQQHNIEVNAGIQWSTASFPEEEETLFESYALRRKGDNESIGPTLHSASISLEIKLTERSSSIFLHFSRKGSVTRCYISDG